MSLTIYGIKACETMKKARAWLSRAGVDVSFHDYKAVGIDRETLEGWVKTHGWETLLNRKGSTFRALADADKQDLDADKAIRLMLSNPSMIKRPVLVNSDEESIVGFNPEFYAGFLNK